jgi:hypothetical protein
VIKEINKYLVDMILINYFRSGPSVIVGYSLAVASYQAISHKQGLVTKEKDGKSPTAGSHFMFVLPRRAAGAAAGSHFLFVPGPAEYVIQRHVVAFMA